jgi:hypothetical protein
MPVSVEEQHGFHKTKLQTLEKRVSAKKPAELVIEVEPDVFLLNGNSHVGKGDPFKIVGRYTTKASALQAAEDLFEKMGLLSLSPTVKSNKKRGAEQSVVSPVFFMEEPPKTDLFEKMGQLSLSRSVKSDKKQGPEQPATRALSFIEEPPAKRKRLI